MLLARPFAHDAALFEAAERGWWALGREDWLEAFRKHPRIGGRTAEQWSRREQAGLDTAGAAARAAPAPGHPALTRRLRVPLFVWAPREAAREVRRRLPS